MELKLTQLPKTAVSQDLVVEGVKTTSLTPAAFRPEYDRQFRTLIADAVRSGQHIDEIAVQLRVHRFTCFRYRAKIDAFGVHNPAPCGVIGRRRKVTPAIEQALVQFLNDCEQSPYLDEAQILLRDEYDIDISIATISRSLKRIKWTHKKAQRVHPGRDEHLRNQYLD